MRGFGYRGYRFIINNLPYPVLPLDAFSYLLHNKQMEIITRQDAIQSRLSKYFTGVACRNGHIAERYTQSSVCKDCLRPARNITPGPPRITKFDRNLLLAADMVRLKFVLHNEDVETFRFMHLTLSQSRDESVTLPDLLTGIIPRERGPNRRLHVLRVFPEHVEALREFEQSLGAAR